ncbi:MULTISPECIES: HPr family phosphocarrier protein [Paraliobacillus]|uniref:HPr family phosphocarrier protein n=1 Tax=Paraliobacillus TaxID=200903 RepID=UPI000DD2D556|nr:MULTISPECIES: HPr family phosphocarrier protein [Paraliobacillus]
MKKQSYILVNPLGLHFRPASLIIEKALLYTCQITLCRDTEVAHTNSIMSLLKLGAKGGEEIIVIANGIDENEAVKAIGEIIESNKD